MTDTKNSPTSLVLAVAGASATAAGLIYLAGWKLGFVFVAIWLYEMWTVFNKYPCDTISEIIQEASYERPFIPYIVGTTNGYILYIVVHSHNPKHLILMGGWLFLCGHWFFQNKRREA